MRKLIFLLCILLFAVSAKAQTAYPLAGNARDTGVFKGSVRIDNRIKAPYFKAPSGDTMVICADAAGNFFAITIGQVRTGEPGGGGGTTYYPGYAIKIEGDSIKADTSELAGYFVRDKDSTIQFVTPTQFATGLATKANVADITNLQAVLNSKLDSLTVSNDSFYTWKNGVRSFLYYNDHYSKAQTNSLLAGKSDIGHTHSQYIGKTEYFGAVNPRVNADSNSFTFGDATFSQPYGVNIYGGVYAALNFKSDLNFIGMTPRSSTPTADGTNLGTWQVNKMTNSGLNSAGSINFIAAGGSSTRFSYIDILTANNRSAFIGREGIRGHSFTSGSVGMVSISSSSESGLFYANPQAGYSFPLYHGIKSVGSSQPLFKLDRDNGQVLSLIDKDGILTTTSYIFKNDTVITSDFTVSDSNNYIYVNTSGGNVSVSFSSTLKKEHVWYIKKISSDNNTVTITSPDASIDGDGNISFADKRSIRIHHKDSLNFETNNLIAEQDVDHVHGTDFGMISDLVYGNFNSVANSDTITATTALFRSGDEGKIIFVAGIRNPDGFYNDTTFGLTSIITHYVSPTRVVIADTADYTRTNKIGYFGTENTDKYYAAVKYAADHNIAGVEANGTGGYLFAPQFSSLKDSACFPIRHDVILKAYPGINFFKLCIEDNMHVDSSKDYAYTFFKMFGTVNIIYDGLTLVAPHNYDDYKTGGVRAFTYKNAGSQSNGQVIFKDVKVIGDTNSHYPNYDIQWANFYENSARVGTNGGTHSTYIYNCVAQTRVGAISMFDDTTGKSLYIDGFTTYNGGSREMARPVGAHAQMSSGSHILDITDITGFSFYPDNTQYTDYNRNYAVKIVYGTDTFTSIIDSIVDANTAYLHDAAPSNIVNGTYYSYSAGGNLEGENFYIDNTVDIVMKNVRQINPYKWGLHIYTTDTKPDAKIRDYINFETIRDGMLYGIQGNGDIVGRHGTPVINLTHCKMEYSPFNQPLKINARDCYFPRQALFYAKSTITNCTFEKEAYGNAAGDTVTFNNCIALSYVTGAGCYNKVLGGVSKYFNNDARTSYINTVDSNGHQFNNKLRAGSPTDRVRLITTQGEEKYIAADTFTQAVKRTFRKSGTDSVFAVSIKGDTTFQFIDSIGAGGGSGEANTASNLGGGVGLFYNKIGFDLRFNSLESTQFTLTGNVISLNSTMKATWDDAYSWGNHASAGYITSSTAASTYQPLDADLTALAGLTPTNDDVLQRKAGGWVNRSIAQLKSDFNLTKSDVGLSNVDNTPDASKPVSTAQQTAIDAKVADAINDGTTTIAPSQNAVFDALVLKLTIAKYIVNETPSGSVNGSNVTFTLTNTPVAGTVSVYLNGLLQEFGAGADCTISGSTLTYNTAPSTGDKIRVTYISQ